MPKVFYVLVLCTVLVTSIINNASGQSDEPIATIIVLDPLPSKVIIGESLYFSGRLETIDGHGLADMPIEIWATHDRGAFVLLETISDDNGNFKAEWIVEYGGIKYFDVIFPGNENYEGSESERQTVDFRNPGTIYPELELNPVMPVMIAGKSVFSGYLKTEDGKGIADAKIIIEAYDDEANFFDIATAITDSNGFFQTKVNIQTQVSEFLTITAHYEGENEITSAYSDSYDIRYISELNGISSYKEEYYLKETITIVGAFRGQLSDVESKFVKVELTDPLGISYDSHNVPLETDGTFSDELTIEDGLTGRYTVKAYLNDDSLTTDFVLLNKADINQDTIYGPYCRSDDIEMPEGIAIGDIPMMGKTFTLYHEDETFDILVFDCGNEVESLAFNQQDRYIIIKGVESTPIEVLLPSRLLNGDFTVFGEDGEELEFELLTPEEYSADLGYDFAHPESKEHFMDIGLELLISQDINVIRFDPQYHETITIQGTTVIPEFPVAMTTLAVIMLITILFITKIKGDIISKNLKRLECE